MVQKNKNRYEWKMPLSLVFLGQSREQPQCYAPKSNYTEPFRMTPLMESTTLAKKECIRLHSPVEVSGGRIKKEKGIATNK